MTLKSPIFIRLQYLLLRKRQEDFHLFSPQIWGAGGAYKGRKPIIPSLVLPPNLGRAGGACKGRKPIIPSLVLPPNLGGWGGLQRKKTYYSIQMIVISYYFINNLPWSGYGLVGQNLKK